MALAVARGRQNAGKVCQEQAVMSQLSLEQDRWTTRQEGVPIQSSVGSRRDSGSWGCPDPQPGRASVQSQDRSQGCGEARAGSVHAEVLELAPQISFVFCKQDGLGPGPGRPAGSLLQGDRDPGHRPSRDGERNPAGHYISFTILDQEGWEK